jgi:hypothetical protein
VTNIDCRYITPVGAVDVRGRPRTLQPVTGGRHSAGDSRRADDPPRSLPHVMVGTMDSRPKASADQLRPLQNVYSLLHRYAPRAAQVSPLVEVGSSLHRDHERSPLIEIGNRAHLHLRVAYEFLVATGEHIAATKTVHPFGVEQALGRTALMASAKALYILRYDSSDARIARCAAIMAKDGSKLPSRSSRDSQRVG